MFPHFTAGDHWDLMVNYGTKENIYKTQNLQNTKF